MVDLIAGHEPVIALVLLGLVFIAFAIERYPPDVTAAAGAAVFVLIGLVPTDDVMAAFSNSAPITIAAMFVISGSLVRTGVLDAIADAIVSRAQKAPVSSLAVFFIATMIASGFMNNTPVVLILIPVVIRLAGALGLASTKLLIPLSYAAILGGTCTLIGTSTNLLVDGVATDAGLEPFGIFEIAPVGIVAVLAGVLTMLLAGRYILPSRENNGAQSMNTQPTFLSEATILEESELIGQTLAEVSAFNRPHLKLTGVRRGARILRTGLDGLVLQKGDAVIFVTTTSEVLTLNEMAGIQLGMRRSVPGGTTDATTIAEAIIAPSRGLAGSKVSELGLGRRYGVRLLGVNRHRHIAGPNLPDVILRPADRLLIEGSSAAFDALSRNGDLVAITGTTGRSYRRRQAPVAVLALVAVVVLAALDVMSIGLLAMIAVAAILVLRCIDNDEAWGSIDASVLILIFSMLIIGAGLDNTGAVQMVVNWISPTLEILPPILVLAAVYATASILTELVTNNAVAVILTPIAIGVATNAGLDPRAFVVAVMIGASASFATPIGYQTNTLVYGAGNYRFTDFIKVGIPMNVTVGIASVLAIMLFFPLTPQ